MLNKHSSGRWFETSWRSCGITVMCIPGTYKFLVYRPAITYRKTVSFTTPMAKKFVKFGESEKWFCRFHCGSPGQNDITKNPQPSIWACLNTLRPRRNRCHYADDIFKCIFLHEHVWISVEISLKLVPKGPINNIPALVQIMAWRRSGDKPLSEPMMVSLSTHICVTRPTHWPLAKMATISQTMFLNAFSWMKMFEFYNKNPCAWLLWHGSSRGQLALCNPWGR